MPLSVWGRWVNNTLITDSILESFDAFHLHIIELLQLLRDEQDEASRSNWWNMRAVWKRREKAHELLLLITADASAMRYVKWNEWRKGKSEQGLGPAGFLLLSLCTSIITWQIVEVRQEYLLFLLAAFELAPEKISGSCKWFCHLYENVLSLQVAWPQLENVLARVWMPSHLNNLVSKLSHACCNGFLNLNYVLTFTRLFYNVSLFI